MFESRKNMAGSTAIFLVAVACVCDVKNKTGTCDRSVYYVMSLPFSALH